MSKTRMAVKLNQNEAFVVLPIEQWRHLLEVYKTLALSPDNSEYDYETWMSWHNFIEEQVNNTYVGDYGDDD